MKDLDINQFHDIVSIHLPNDVLIMLLIIDDKIKSKTKRTNSNLIQNE